MKLVVKAGRLIDPAQKLDGLYDVVVQDGRVADLVQGGLKKMPEGAEVYDASKAVVAPGLVDVHAHLREPGQEYKEDILSGSRAAAAGGYTTVCCMANTSPINDNAQVTQFIRDRAQDAGLINIRPIGAITKGFEGKELAEMADMLAAGAVAFSDVPRSIRSAEVMRRALEYARGLGAVIIDHAEDSDLAREGVMNEGLVSTRLGLRGNPATAEAVQVARDAAIAGAARARVHLAHITTRGAIEQIRWARERGVLVTAEATPHHLLLNEEAVNGYDTDAKMAPPLRTEEDRQALCAALAEGVIDCIATGHAPHTPDEKAREFDLAPFGVIGLESALPAALALVEQGVLDLPTLLERMTSGAARVLGLNCGHLKKGAQADLVVFDPKAGVKIDASAFRSKGRNCPFDGKSFNGKVLATFCGGRRVYGE